MTLLNIVRGAFAVSGIYLLLQDRTFRHYANKIVPVKPLLDRYLPLQEGGADKLIEQTKQVAGRARDKWRGTHEGAKDETPGIDNMRTDTRRYEY